MSPEQVQAILSDFKRHATRIHTRGDASEVWRFGVDQHQYELHFYPDDDTTLKRYVGGAAAAREFTQLQALQKLTVPATRVIANLKGFRLGDRKGDACIVVFDPRTRPLDAVLRSLPDRRTRLTLQAELIERLEALHRHKLCPTPLHVHAFGERTGRVLLLDGTRLQSGIVDGRRLAELDASTRHVTSATDRLRMWKHFSDQKPPRNDRELHRLARQLVGDANEAENAFGAVYLSTDSGEWTGRCIRRVPLTLPWSVANGATFDDRMWNDALPTLLAAQGERFKDDAAARIEVSRFDVGGTSLELVIKRPAVRGGVLARFRESRVRRMWRKNWRMLALGFACEMPVLMAERHHKGRLIEQVLVTERVSGPTLASADLNALSAAERERLFYLVGRTLRLIERAGATHCDAKSSNWILWTDPTSRRVRPILIDLDGVRFYRWRGHGMQRLLRALNQHPQIAPHDLQTLNAGYARPR